MRRSGYCEADYARIAAVFLVSKSGGSVTMEYNRNLSSVIDSIQDEGPSSSVREGATGGDESVGDMYKDKSVAPGKKTGPSVPWILFIALFAGLVAAGTLLFFSEGGDEQQAVALPESATAVLTDTGTLDTQLQEIRETQRQLGDRLSQLTVAVIEIGGVVKQWHGRQADQPGQQAGISEDLPAAPDRQDPLSSRNGGVFVNQADTASVPAGNVSVGADTERESIPALQAEAGAAQVPEVETATLSDSTHAAGVQTGVERDPAADIQPDVNATPAEPASNQVSAEQEWVINVGYFQKQDLIQKFMAKLGQAGIVAEQQQVIIDGRTGYRLRIPGFSTRLEASEYAKRNLGNHLEIKDPWVSRR